MRHLIQLCLLVALLLALPATVLAQFDYVTNSNNTITITRYNGTHAEVLIPDTTNGYPITSIGFNAFGGCTNMTHVMIPNSVTNIGNYAFFYCTDLTDVTIPDSVTYLGDHVFDVCHSLTNITLPNKIARIGTNAFSDCDNLQNILIPNGVNYIGSYAFFGCHSLTNVTLPGSLIGIGDNAFNYCTSLTTITIPDSVTTIGDYAFAGCSNLGTITIPGGVTNLGDQAFAGCTNLKSAFFTGNPPIIGGSVIYLFDNSPDVTVYYLPEAIGWLSFYGWRPTTLWLPQMQSVAVNFGGVNAFGFNFNWTSGRTVVVEACANLSNPDWQPVQTNTLATGSAYFSDPQWTNYPGRFYRLRSP